MQNYNNWKRQKTSLSEIAHRNATFALNGKHFIIFPIQCNKYGVFLARFTEIPNMIHSNMYLISLFTIQYALLSHNLTNWMESFPSIVQTYFMHGKSNAEYRICSKFREISQKSVFFIYDKARGKVKIDFPLKIIFAEKEMDSSPTRSLTFYPPFPLCFTLVPPLSLVQANKTCFVVWTNIKHAKYNTNRI